MLKKEKRLIDAPLPYRRPIIKHSFKGHDGLRAEKLRPERLSPVAKERGSSISRSNVFQVNDDWAKGWCGRRRPDVVYLRFEPWPGVTFVLCHLLN
jgi:hypothetical protein